MEDDGSERVFRWLKRHGQMLSMAGTRWRDAENRGDLESANREKSVFYIHARACDALRALFAPANIPSSGGCPECGSNAHDGCLMLEDDPLDHREVLDFIEECQEVRSSVLSTEALDNIDIHFMSFVETAERIARKLVELRPAVSELEEALENCQMGLIELMDSMSVEEEVIH